MEPVSHVMMVVLNAHHPQNVTTVLPKPLTMVMEHVNVLLELSSKFQPTV
jgi:hypothetical protein